MSKFKEKISLLLIICMVIVCLLPSVFYGEVERTDFLFQADVFIGGFAVMFFVFSWYGYFPRLISAVMGMLTLLALITLMLMFSYHFFLNANVISLVFETMSQISAAYLKSLPWVFYAIIFMLLLATIFCIIYPLSFKKSIRSRIVLLSTAILFLAACHIGISDEVVEDRYKIEGNEYLSYDGQNRNELLRSIFPVFIPYIIKDYHHQRKEVLLMSEIFTDYKFDVVDDGKKTERQVYVFVLGENSRADHWGINGYSRNTTPYLSKRDDVVNFEKMFVYQSVTRYSVPTMLSRKPIDLALDYFHEPSIITYFKNIGYETAWISLPQQFGQGESAISVYAYEADNMVFINPAGFNNRTKPDTVSIPYIEDLIEKSDKDLFLVIHTLGSHQRFEDRYDDDMRVFQPDRFPNREANIYAKADQEVFINSYDNSILATDHFLDSLINTLAEKNLSSLVFFVADHGESLFDDGSIVIGHGTQTFATLQPAAVFWASPEYKAANAEKVENLRGNAANLTTIDMLFDTFVSLSGGKLSDSRQQLDMTKDELVPPQVVVDLLKEKSILDYKPAH